MAIKIRKKVEEEQPIQALEPEVLPPEGAEAASAPASSEAGVNPTIPGMDDKFLSKTGSMMEWLMEHRRMVILVVSILIVAAFSVIGVRRMLESQATDKSSKLSGAFVTYTALTKAEADELEAANLEYIKSQGIAADTSEALRATYTVPSNEARFNVIGKYLSETLPTLEGESVGTSGQLMLGGSMVRNNHADKASSAYQKAMTSEAEDIKLYGQLGEVEMLLNAKKYDQAIAILNDVMKVHPGLSAYATLEIGRIYELSGAVDKAIAAYAQVTRELGQETDKALAVTRLKFLTADWEKYAKPAQVAAAPAPAAPQAAL